MNSDELRALADALEPMARAPRFEDFDVPGFCAWLRACADARPVPAGWKLVPVEPTPEMLSAVGMMDGYDWHAPGCSPDADHANWYSAMIAAAPAAPQAEPKREALSDDEILDILDIATAADLRFSMYSDDVETRAAIKRLARAVERAAYERAAQEK